ncbi:hypothetical protein [uncultured Oscillibacter sp.]|uniref:hypothetical protein n=1 Tax=uncultured Oscillibacter sp. TaxID=876091 RepID=UPI0025D17764|nr:hypothetical protein [uncultured Oscillibacter sp.]
MDGYKQIVNKRRRIFKHCPFQENTGAAVSFQPCRQAKKRAFQAQILFSAVDFSGAVCYALFNGSPERGSLPPSAPPPGNTHRKEGEDAARLRGAKRPAKSTESLLRKTESKKISFTFVGWTAIIYLLRGIDN